MNKLLSGSLLAFSTLMVGCSVSDDDPAQSSDFATSAIDAFYYFEVDADNGVAFRVNFEHDDKSLTLDGGDKAQVVSGDDTHSLSEVKSGSTVNYVANVDEGSTLPANYQFQLLRDSQQDSDNSFVTVPISFDVNSPTTDSTIAATNNRYFTISWDDNGSDNARFDLRFDFNCSRIDGTSAISSNRTYEDVADNGSYQVDLLDVVGNNSIQVCNDFDITAWRIRTGALDLANLNGGSIRGAQVRQVLNLTIESINLNP